VANKIRNIETGKIEKTFVPLNIPNGDFMDKDIFIIDDICDGGRTFLEIAKTIKEDKKFIGKIYLIVTHGIFSSGFNDLNEYFDGIYTTNSVNQWSTDYQSFPEHSKLKQLNVF
jgi:ribose-phosphate pyrophosphokinase